MAATLEQIMSTQAFNKALESLKTKYDKDNDGKISGAEQVSLTLDVGVGSIMAMMDQEIKDEPILANKLKIAIKKDYIKIERDADGNITPEAMKKFSALEQTQVNDIFKELGQPVTTTDPNVITINGNLNGKTVTITGGAVSAATSTPVGTSTNTPTPTAEQPKVAKPARTKIAGKTFISNAGLDNPLVQKLLTGSLSENGDLDDKKIAASAEQVHTLLKEQDGSVKIDKFEEQLKGFGVEVDADLLTEAERKSGILTPEAFKEKAKQFIGIANQQNKELASSLTSDEAKTREEKLAEEKKKQDATAMGTIMGAVGGILGGDFSGLISSVVNGITKYGDQFWNMLADAWNSFSDKISSGFAKAKDFVGEKTGWFKTSDKTASVETVEQKTYAENAKGKATPDSHVIEQARYAATNLTLKDNGRGHEIDKTPAVRAAAETKNQIGG